MEIKSSEINKNLIELKLDGKLDLNASNPLKEEVNKYLEEKDEIVLNLESVNFANSSGLGLLVSILKSSKSKNVKLYLTNLQPYIKELLEVTQLDRIFNIEESIDNIK